MAEEISFSNILEENPKQKKLQDLIDDIEGELKNFEDGSVGVTSYIAEGGGANYTRRYKRNRRYVKRGG